MLLYPAEMQSYLWVFAANGLRHLYRRLSCAVADRILALCCRCRAQAAARPVRSVAQLAQLQPLWTHCAPTPGRGSHGSAGAAFVDTAYIESLLEQDSARRPAQCRPTLAGCCWNHRMVCGLVFCSLLRLSSYHYGMCCSAVDSRCVCWQCAVLWSTARVQWSIHLSKILVYLFS